MLGTQKYKLPGAKRKQAPVEPKEPVESDEDQAYKDVSQEDHDISTSTIQFEEAYVEDTSRTVQEDSSDDYYFEVQEEPEKPSPLVALRIESDRSDIVTFEDIAQVAMPVVDDGAKGDDAKKAGDFHARDESLPFVSPPGYVWLESTGSQVPFWSMDRILNFIGVGDSAERFRPRAEVEEEDSTALLPLLSAPGEDADTARQSYENKKRIEKEYANKKALSVKGEGEMQEEMGFKLDDIVAAEPSEGPRGWMFWYGDRWNHWWYGYESPTSITGYPAQWFYRTVHLFFPETYNSFKYDKSYGEINLRPMPQTMWWLVTHPCLYQIILNCAIITPLAFIPQLRKRFKIIDDKIKFSRTLMQSASEFWPIIWRRMSYRRFRKTRNRYWRWVIFFTFAFAPNCWDLVGHHIENPTDDFWEKNYLQKFTDGIQTQSAELRQLDKAKPSPNKGIWTTPNVSALKKHQEEVEQDKRWRAEHRKEVFGDEQELRDAWERLHETETERREKQIERAAQELRKSASHPKL